MLVFTSIASTLSLSGIGIAGVGLSSLSLLIVGAITGGGQPASASGRGTPEDHELVRASLDGDGMAYRCLVERYQGRIYAVIYGMVRNREDARELSQDAFVKAFKSLARFRLESSFYTWLCRISMNVAIDHIRRQKLRRTEEFDEGVASRESAGVISLAHHREDPRRNLERKRMRERILEEIEKLVWKVRIDASNEVMRKVEAVEPFFEDELERRRPPLSEPVDIFGKKQGS